MSNRSVAIERQSIVDAPADQVWARVVTPEGINDELRPWMTMSMPRGAESLTVDTVPIVAAGLRALFGHRHRRLQRHFAGSSRQAQT